MTAQEVDCLWCGAAFTRSRRWAYFCESCRVKRNRVKQETRDAARRDRLRDAAEGIAPTLEPDLVPTLQQYVEELDLSEGEDLGLSPDRMPEGANTPYGPDEGRSTFFKDLSGELETLHKEASKADWWDDNPHWNFELHDRAEAAQYFDELKRAREVEPDGCGDAKGTVAGYLRHNRRGQSPCSECREAKRASNW